VNDNVFDFPGGAAVYREYGVMLDSGATGIIAVTLGDIDLDSPTAFLARRCSAPAFGLISLADVPGAPQCPFVWIQDETQLGVTIAEQDGDLSDELRGIIAHYICVFLAEIGPLAREIDGGAFERSTANDNTIH